MKKSIFIPVCMLLSSCLAGCGLAAQGSQSSGKRTDFYGESIILTGGLSATEEEIMDREQKLEVITSWKEWSALSQKLKEEDRSRCNFDQEFFKQKDLLLVCFTAENKNRYSLKQMELNNKSLKIIMNDNEVRFSGLGEYMVNDLLTLREGGMLIEVDKGSVPEDVAWRLIMEEGIYTENLGYIKSVEKTAEGAVLEFDSAERVDDETQPGKEKIVSKGEPAETYDIGNVEQYIISVSGMEYYNQRHEKKLEGNVSDDGGFELEEDAFIKYIEDRNQPGSEEAAFWLTIDEEQMVRICEEDQSSV